MNTELRDPVGLDDGEVPYSDFLCPRCSKPLLWAHNHVAADGSITPHVEQPLLVCPWSEHTFPVRDGVPILIPPDLDEGQAETVDTFARKWAHAPEKMLDERRRIANAWFMRRFGSSLTHLSVLETLSRPGRRILDAGCGLGNLTELLAQRAPNATVWGVDLSPAVHLVPRVANIRLVQGDITALPVAGDFNLIVADGVLHHTAETRAAMHALAGRLAPGGDFLFYVYKRKAPIREYADDYLRAQIAKMTNEEAMETCEALAALARTLRLAEITIRVEKPIPILGIEAGSHDLHRLVYWHFLKCFFDDDAADTGDLTTSTLENYDWYRPKYAWRHTREEVEGWISAATLETVMINEVEAGFAVHVRRPR